MVGKGYYSDIAVKDNTVYAMMETEDTIGSMDVSAIDVFALKDGNIENKKKITTTPKLTKLDSLTSDVYKDQLILYANNSVLSYNLLEGEWGWYLTAGEELYQDLEEQFDNLNQIHPTILGDQLYITNVFTTNRIFRLLILRQVRRFTTIIWNKK